MDLYVSCDCYKQAIIISLQILITRSLRFDKQHVLYKEWNELTNIINEHQLRIVKVLTIIQIFAFLCIVFLRAIFKLYIYIPTNCTQLIYFINNTLKHMYCLKLCPDRTRQDPTHTLQQACCCIYSLVTEVKTSIVSPWGWSLSDRNM